MKKYYCLLFFFLLFLLWLPSQAQKKIDSLAVKWVNAIENENYNKATEYGETTLKEVKNVFGTESISYIAVCNKLNFVYILNQDFKKAQKEAIKGYHLSKKILGESHKLHEEAMQILSHACRELGDNTGLDTLLGMRRKFYDENSWEYAIYLNDVAEYNRTIGNYAKAEKNYKKAISLFRKTQGKNEQYAVMKNNLGLLYFKMGFYDKALEQYYTAKRILEKPENTNKRYYMITMNNIASAYLAQNKYYKCEKLLLDNNKMMDKNTVEYLSNIYTLGFLYHEMNKNKNAEKYFKECIKINSKIRHSENYIYQAASNSLAIIYSEQGRFKKSKRYFMNCLEAMDKTNKYKPINYYNTLMNLGDIYYSTNEHKKAKQLFLEALQGFSININKTFPYLTDNERFKFFEQYSTNIEAFQNFVFDAHKQFPALTENLINASLKFKSIILFNSIAQRSIIERINKETMRNNIKQLRTIRQEIARKLTSGKSTDKHIDTLQRAAENLEKKIIEESTNNQNIIKAIINSGEIEQVTYKQLQKHLTNEEVIVELIHFERYKKRRWKNKILYCALIVKKNSKYPQLTYLGTEQELLSILKQPKDKHNATHINEIYHYQPNKSANNNSLYLALWKKIETNLDGIKKIYISPTGILHTVAFDAISLNDTLRVNQKYDIEYVFSAKEILNNQLLYYKQIKSVALFGGIQYQTDSTSLKEAAKIYSTQKNTRSYSLNNKSLVNKINLDSLPGTYTEIQRIDTLFNEINIKTSVYNSQYANEEAFKYVARQNINLIHIGTHGYYYPTKGQESQKMNLYNNPISHFHTSNPLINSGLFLAGVNHVLNDKPPITGIEDGILSAYEISLLWMPHTKLVTLSACQTGLGDVKGSEGIMGLSRAFKKAGVDFLIISLWKVPDYQTNELMVRFYKFFIQGKEIRHAFSLAQNYIQNKYSNPYYWAGFRLIH